MTAVNAKVEISALNEGWTVTFAKNAGKMNKVILWEYLKDNPGWHTAVELRKEFDVKQQATLRGWLDYPFIASYTPSRGKSYKFLTNKMDAYEETLKHETYVPEPKKIVVKNKEINIPKELMDERFTLKFPFRDSELYEMAKAQARGIAALGPEFNWVKDAILSVGNNKLSETHKRASDAMIVVLAAMLRYNTFDFSEMMKIIEDSMAPETVGEKTLEDIRKAELDDIMKHHPSFKAHLTPNNVVKMPTRPEINVNEFPEEWLT